MQEINSRCFIADLRPHQVVIPSRDKAQKLMRLLISLSGRMQTHSQTYAAYERRSVVAR
nr:hypothetical protein [uncultured Campylobacter sp.]